jgi:hypothetical protein
VSGVPGGGESGAVSAGTCLHPARQLRAGSRTRPEAGRLHTRGLGASSRRSEACSRPGGRDPAPCGGSPPDGRLGVPATYPCTDKGRPQRPPRHVRGPRTRRFARFAQRRFVLRGLRTPLRRLRRTPPRARGGSHPSAPKRRATRRPRALPLPHASDRRGGLSTGGSPAGPVA